jgi:hypothetical protein
MGACRVAPACRQNGQQDRNGYITAFAVPPLEPVLLADAHGNDTSLDSLDPFLKAAVWVLDNKRRVAQGRDPLPAPDDVKVDAATLGGPLVPMPVASSV